MSASLNEVELLENGSNAFLCVVADDIVVANVVFVWPELCFSGTADKPSKGSNTEDELMLLLPYGVLICARPMGLDVCEVAGVALGSFCMKSNEV